MSAALAGSAGLLDLPGGVHPARGAERDDSADPALDSADRVHAVGGLVRPDETAQLTLTLNISARQFRRTDFVDQVLACIEGTGANPSRLKLEIAESLLLDDVEDTVAKIIALKARGVGFALDDFDTGYPSMSYLKRLPFDQLRRPRHAGFSPAGSSSLALP
jgi:EAL domain-containing protein (putative c-di-GMP-specific phosphodiesterase class I)